MKQAITTLFALVCLAAHAQVPAMSYAALPKDSASQHVAYTAVVQVPGVAKEALFVRAQEWVARNMSASDAARVEDKAAGTLLVHGNFANPGPENTYQFTLAIYTKEGRYKYVVDQLSRTWGVLNGGRWAAGPVTKPLEYFGTVKLNKGQQGELMAVDAKIKELAASLTSAMQAGGQQKGW